MVQSASPDYSQITFPTDALTFGEIRKHQPHLFESVFKPGTPRYRLSDLEVLATHSVERVLATRAYSAALGDTDAANDGPGRFTHQEGVWMLNEDYKRYGISTGLHQTRQLVRRFETVAAAQARTKDR